MRSHKPVTVEPLDLLITKALRAQVGNAEPPPGTWDRISQEARARAIQRRPRTGRVATSAKQDRQA
jgi:hypothetical protein